MKILEIFADASGDTHFRSLEVDMSSVSYVPPSAPVHVSAEMQMTTGMFLSAPPGWDDEYHDSPRRQYAIVLGGRLKVTCTDGDTRTFEPGDMVLLNDTGSKGHLSQVQGDKPASFFLVGASS